MWTKEHTREYNRRYAQTHREQIRVRHREYMRRKRHSKIKANYQFPVSELQIIREGKVSLP